jgi:hypothetical protein
VKSAVPGVIKVRLYNLATVGFNFCKKKLNSMSLDLLVQWVVTFSGSNPFNESVSTKS